MSKRVWLVLFFVVISNAVVAADWSSCASDLDSLRRRASDASTAAEEADSKKQKFDRAAEEYRNCRSMPAVYDLFRDGCSTKRSEAESAQRYYKSAVSDAESALSDVDSKVRSVNASCETSSTPSAATTYLNSLPPDLRQKCAVFTRFMGRLPKDQLIGHCRKQLSAEDCARCVP